ncbi:MAG: hypothetical protein AB7E80_01635 [Hyphomicrobiaceae bacterium]
MHCATRAGAAGGRGFVGATTALLLTLSGCAGGIGEPMRVHGNFCGPNHPKLTSKTRLDALHELNAIPPIDDIDEACKLHDMCYANTSTGNMDCDLQLNNDLAIAWIWDHPACTRLAYHIGYGILMGSSGIRTRPEELTPLNSVVHVPAAAVRFTMFSAAKAINAPYFAAGAAMIETEYQQAGAPPLPSGHVCRKLHPRPGSEVAARRASRQTRSLEGLQNRRR